MSRTPLVVISAGVLLAGVFAFRGTPAVSHVHATRRMAAPSHADIPAQPGRAPSLPMRNAMTDSTPITVAMELIVRGASRWAIARVSLDGDELLVSAPDGRIPVFGDADSALAFATRVLPHEPDAEQAALWDSLGRAMSHEGFRYDLDAAYAWSTSPRREVLTPDSLLATWSLLSLASELPERPGADPMWMALARGEDGRRPLDEMQELRLSLMKVDLVVSLAERDPARGRTSEARTPVAWPAGDLWTDADAARVARHMEPAITAFTARLSGDVDDIERALRQ